MNHLLAKQLKNTRMVYIYIFFFTNDTLFVLGKLKISSRMHYQNLGSRKKILISETKSDMIYCKMNWLYICGNVFNKLFKELFKK